MGYYHYSVLVSNKDISIFCYAAIVGCCLLVLSTTPKLFFED